MTRMSAVVTSLRARRSSAAIPRAPAAETLQGRRAGQPRREQPRPRPRPRTRRAGRQARGTRFRGWRRRSRLCVRPGTQPSSEWGFVPATGAGAVGATAKRSGRGGNSATWRRATPAAMPRIQVASDLTFAYSGIVKRAQGHQECPPPPNWGRGVVRRGYMWDTSQQDRRESRRLKLHAATRLNAPYWLMRGGPRGCQLPPRHPRGSRQ